MRTRRNKCNNMTIGKLLANIGAKDFNDRFEYNHGPIHEQHEHVYYSYEQPHRGHSHATSKHHYGGGKKNNAAMSALTLLAFLFFLHILQQCLKEHMQSMTTPQIMIMSAREGEEPLPKIPDYKKIDKAGKNGDGQKKSATIPMTKIQIAEHKPKPRPVYTQVQQRYRNATLSYDNN